MPPPSAAQPQWAPPCHPTCCRGHREVCTWGRGLWVREEGFTCVHAGGRSLRSLWREGSSTVTGSHLLSGKISLGSSGSMNTGDLLGGIGVAPARGRGVRDGGARALGWGRSSGVFPGSWLSQVRCLSQEEVASGVGPWGSSVHWGDGELGTTEHPCRTGGRGGRAVLVPVPEEPGVSLAGAQRAGGPGTAQRVAAKWGPYWSPEDLWHSSFALNVFFFI